MTQHGPPARGTRPRNRRALIVAAAAELFADRGYDQVNVGDIAGAVAIGPSALYRHFSGKQQLLAEVISAGLAPVREVVDGLDLTDRAGALRRLSALALDERHLGVLWQRESRHLSPADRAGTLTALEEIGQRLGAWVREARPELNTTARELVAWCVLAVLVRPSFHRLDIPRPDYEQLLAEMAGAVLDTPVPADLPGPAPSAPPAGLMPATRREAILAEAVRMFAAHGFAAVGNDDIGAAVGIAGPSIYHHFPSKTDILVTAFQRGTAVLFTDLSAAHRQAADADDALRKLIRSYLTFAHANQDLIGLLVTEVKHLPDEARRAARQAQHDYISEWVHLVRMIRPDVDPVQARIRVHTVIGIANDTARAARRHRIPSIIATLETMSRRLLPPATR